jgi:hypothetical protein
MLTNSKIPLSFALVLATVSTRLQVVDSDDRLMLAIAAMAAITFIVSVLGLFWLP